MEAQNDMIVVTNNFSLLFLTLSILLLPYTNDSDFELLYL